MDVDVGDDVALNQTLCTLETAKAEVEIPSPYAGRVVELGGTAGDVLPVGAVLVRIDTGVAAGEAKTNGAVRNPVLVGYGADAEADSSRRAGRGTSPVEESRNQAQRDDNAGRGTSPVEESRNQAQRPRAKPAVRKLASELLVDLATLEPGPDGVISREAVLAAAGVHGEQSRGVTYDVLPVRGVHAEMAKRMALSRSEIPDAHASVDVDGTRLLELRDSLGLTPFAVTLRLLVLALTHHRIFNSTWVDGPDGAQVHTHHAVHLGVAVAAPRGLLVPVIREAQAKTTRELAEAVTHLTATARDGTVKPAELVGSTFTVSNFGALGLDEGVPVINHPEAASWGWGRCVRGRSSSTVPLLFVPR